MSSLDLVASQLGLVQKNNNDYKGFDGIFIDDARVKENLELSLITPDTYVEDGNYVNDHTIFYPQVLTIEGEVGEVYQKDSSFLTEYFRGNKKLGVISQYIPTRTATQISKINGIVNSGINVIRQADKVQGDIDYVKGSFSGGKKTIQTQFIDFVNNDLYTLGKLISIETGLGYFSDMKLINASLTKDNSGNFTSYKLTFKKWRTAKTILSPFDSVVNNSTDGKGKKNKVAGDSKNQTAKTSDKGVVQGKENQSFVYKGYTDVKKIFSGQ